MSYLAFQQRTDMNSTQVVSRHGRKISNEPEAPQTFQSEYYENEIKPEETQKEPELPKKSGFFGFGSQQVSETSEPETSQNSDEKTENNSETTVNTETPSLARRFAGGIFGGVKAVGSLGYAATSTVIGGGVAVVKGVGGGAVTVVSKTASGVGAVAGGTYNTIRHPIDSVKGAASMTVEGAKKVGSGTVNVVTGTVGAVGTGVGAVAGAVGTVGKSTYNVVTNPKDAVLSTSSAVLNTAKKPFETAPKSKAE